ncbi:MAG: hypothetical protein KGJ86_18555 [Chloroflexota bacterium]|nr:hypothetical protein [Chloroflexota bacterium]
MNAAQQLYELQTLDIRIAADTAKLEAERAKIQEPKALGGARTRTQAAESAVAAARKALREGEMEVDAVAAKKNAVHDKLYGGKVTVPRELSALEAEEESLAHTQARLEDQTLELMSRLDEAEKQLASAQAALEEEMARWRREGGEAHAHLPGMEAAIAELRAERSALAETIAPANLATYERLRPRKNNRPVAAVEKNTCQGCGVSLPSGEVQRARAADPPHLCDNCGRILYVR